MSLRPICVSGGNYLIHVKDCATVVNYLFHQKKKGGFAATLYPRKFNV
jgi:hypothetical protein